MEQMYYNETMELGQNLPTPDRQYKDRLFRMIFKDPKELLALYNALNGSTYDQPEKLIIATLENAVYMGLKNDVAFLLHSHLSLYEHQSTYNPNLPLRSLFYVSGIFSSLTKDDNLFGTKRIPLPRPRFVVFYNGMTPLPERSVMRLSDAFEGPPDGEETESELELKVLVLNINPSFNETLMEQCQTLKEYSAYVTKVREYHREMELEKAVERAVSECIREGILAEFLKKNRAEVVAMSIFEYNAELHMKQEREQWYEIGREEGYHSGYTSGKEEARRNIIRRLALEMLKNHEPLERIMEYTGLTAEEVEQLKA